MPSCVNSASPSKSQNAPRASEWYQRESSAFRTNQPSPLATTPASVSSSGASGTIGASLVRGRVAGMCFELDSSPPIPVVRGAAVSHDDVVLESVDGTRFAAFVANPDDPKGVGVAILPDVRGLYRFYEELALRIAERGYTALAFDYFGRTAGAEKRGEDFDYIEHVRKTTPEQGQNDVAAAVAHLRENCAAIFTLGFCFGGRHSWLATAGGHRLPGAVGFYGRPGEGADGQPGPIQRAAEFEAPILAL